jgi:hypothetical protein
MTPENGVILLSLVAAVSVVVVVVVAHNADKATRISLGVATIDRNQSHHLCSLP